MEIMNIYVYIYLCKVNIGIDMEVKFCFIKLRKIYLYKECINLL